MSNQLQVVEEFHGLATFEWQIRRKTIECTIARNTQNELQGIYSTVWT